MHCLIFMCSLEAASIASDLPTNRSKDGSLVSTCALDHIVVNGHMLDLGVRASVNYDKWLTDHFPIIEGASTHVHCVEVVQATEPLHATEKSGTME